MTPQFGVWLSSISFQYTAVTVPVNPEAVTPDNATETFLTTDPTAPDALLPVRTCVAITLPRLPLEETPDKATALAAAIEPAKPEEVTLVRAMSEDCVTEPTEPEAIVVLPLFVHPTV